MHRKFLPPYFKSPSVFDKTEKSEDEKVSYWLEKLHKQEEEKVKTENNKEQLTGTKYGMQAVSSVSRSPPQLQETEKTPEEKGKDEYAQKQASKTEADNQAVNELVRCSDRCIISISSLFPWDLFPNTINVEESRVTFIFRQFLASQSHSVDIKNISNVFIESSLFFATLQVVSRTYIQNDIKIGYLNKKKANRVQMIIEGLRTLAGHNINTSSYQIDELISKIEEIHTSQGRQIN